MMLWNRFHRIGFGSEEDRDNLQQIDGIGRFVEKKLNGMDIQDFPNSKYDTGNL